MAYQLKILRGVGDGENRWQIFSCGEDGGCSVAHALELLNARVPLVDAEGGEAAPIAWDCACLEKKCGACAMVIGGRPALACSMSLRDAADKNGVVTLRPLAKFPRIRDLRVDRESLFDTLEEMRLWLENDAALDDAERRALHYKAAGCLMCGLCLEVCPNFVPGGKFAGALAAAASFRAFDETGTGAHREELREAYKKRFFDGCAKSLACRDVCPAKVPIEELLVKTNAAAVWRRGEKKKR